MQPFRTNPGVYPQLQTPQGLQSTYTKPNFKVV